MEGHGRAGMAEVQPLRHGEKLLYIPQGERCLVFLLGGFRVEEELGAIGVGVRRLEVDSGQRSRVDLDDAVGIRKIQSSMT